MIISAPIFFIPILTFTYIVLLIDGPIKMLEPMNIDCGDKAVSRFQFNTQAMKFNYMCVGGNGMPVSSPETKFTEWQDGGDGGLNFLDRHFLNCGAKKFISAFDEEVQNVGNGQFRQTKAQIRFKYQCRQWPAAINYQVRDLSTPWQDRGGDNQIVFLDRQNVQCLGNEGLTNFKVQTQNNGAQIKFDFSCVSMNFDISPTAEPTAAPSAVPSTAPTMTPTSEPTTMPTAAPTTMPTMTPTVEPTSSPTFPLTTVLMLDGTNRQSGQFGSKSLV
jgi:hypothetical protein